MGARRLPPWLKKTAGDLSKVHGLKAQFRGKKLHTVCEEARCPNLGECFSRGVATFMICGDTCTRACGFCAVHSGKPGALDPLEPAHVANMVDGMGLRHVVITSVARDDLPDEGAAHFAATIRAIRHRTPGITVEVLVPDFHARADCLQLVGDAGPQIFNHNLETVRRLTPKVRSKARYDRSLQVLRDFGAAYPHILTKSGIMLGLGEAPAEVETALHDLRAAGCSVVTIGQYLQPSKSHHPVVEYIHPDQFAHYEQLGKSLGFRYTFSGPFVRSSYMAELQFEEQTKEGLTSPTPPAKPDGASPSTPLCG